MSNVVPINASASLYENGAFRGLVQEVLERHLQPQDRYEVAAILESIGWSDRRAADTFGVQDVFGLADAIWDSIRDNIQYSSFSKAEELSWRQKLYELLRAFLRGTIFALPMAISVISMLTLKFSLWSFENLSVELATSIAIGTILSFMTVGGFTQAIARRGFFYILQGHYMLASRTTFFFIKVGFVLCLVMAVLILAVDMLFTLFPYRMLFHILAYFILLTGIWITVTVMYILKKELYFTGIIVLGIFLVYVLYKILGIDIIFSQLVALTIVSLLCMLLIMRLFRQAEKKAGPTTVSVMPRVSITIYSAMHYFFYGFLYFTFIYIDRIVAWSTNNTYMPYVIWFRGEYEVGMDFALLMLMIPLGISEVNISWFMRKLEAEQKKYMADEAEKMNRFFLRRYIRTQLLQVVTAIGSAILVFWLFHYASNNYFLENAQGFLASEVTQFVLVWALVAYAVLSVFLLNAVILFSLSQPTKINKALIIGLIVNFVVGFLLSRWVDYHYAIFGLLAGSLVVAVLSTINLMKLIKKLDYYLYAAS
ncbi:hypothetical protein [Paenibacillus sp. YYML68]|uniref:hypothetical protein n=1 Tax=Paenibacillus sp. YYML68 TaxID=2909250 RepID=UPI002490AF0F|nr:hypothetical protein [Paenibacillus sp. YYML68]